MATDLAGPRTNAARAADARIALTAFQEIEGMADDDEGAIFDLITNLLHLARRVGIGEPLEELLARCLRNHDAEAAEDPEE